MDTVAGEVASDPKYRPDLSTLASVKAWPATVICLATTIIGLAPGIAGLWPKWWNSMTYSHGLLVAPLCVWLLWKQKPLIQQATIQPAMWALVPLAAALFVWTLSYAANVEIGVQVLFPAVMLLAIFAMAGYQVAIVAAFPIGFLYFAIPVWDLVNETLRFATVAAVEVVLPIISVPAFITGSVVQIPSGSFEIAGGCSGLHFFIVSLALGALYGFQFYRRLTSRAQLLLIAASMALVMNWLRVTIIIIAGHLSDMQSYLLQVDHYYFGWVLFGLMLVPLFIIAQIIEQRERWQEPDAVDDSREAFKEAADVPATGLIAVVMLVLLPALVWGRLSGREEIQFDLRLPPIAGWQGPVVSTGRTWEPDFSGTSGEAQASYQKGEARIDLYVNWYLNQTQGRELISSANSIPGTSMVMRDPGRIRLSETNHGYVPQIREIIIVSAGSVRRLVWYWYVVGERTTTSPVSVKLWQGLQVLTGRDGAGLISLSVICDAQSDPDCAAGRRQIENAISTFAGTLQEALVGLQAPAVN